MAYNRRSKNITQGVARSPNRSMYYALGYEKADFDKPMIGIANGHSTITPCNAGLQRLADAAVVAVKRADANPQTFGTPTISDGMSMGTEGMKYSLVSREVIADCIETCVQGQWMDGVVVIGGCDKNMPGGMIGLARMNVPGIYVYGGTIRPGNWKGVDLTIVSSFEAVGEFTAGRMSQEDFDGIEQNSCPSTGSCGGMYTANTMSSSFEALGMSLLYSSTMANPDQEKVDSAAESVFSWSGFAIDDEPKSDMPSASNDELMVFAVYIPPHDPVVGQAFCSIPSKSSSDIRPAVNSPTASNDDTMVRSTPFQLPGRMVPPYT